MTSKSAKAKAKIKTTWAWIRQVRHLKKYTIWGLIALVVVAAGFGLMTNRNKDTVIVTPPVGSEGTPAKKYDVRLSSQEEGSSIVEIRLPESTKSYWWGNRGLVEDRGLREEGGKFIWTLSLKEGVDSATIQWCIQPTYQDSAQTLDCLKAS